MPQKFESLVEKINQLPKSDLSKLAWLILSDGISLKAIPHSLDDQFNQKADQLIDWLQKIDLDNEADDISKSKALGKYAENLICFFLKKHPDYKLLGSNIQLNQAKKTLGEIDFLFRDLRNGIDYHLEFALKYYLKTSLNDELLFLGPSKKDSLKRKVERMISHQCKLVEKHKELLPDMLQQYNFKSKLIMKGSIFFPFNDWDAMPKVDASNQAWWLHLENLWHLESPHFLYSLHTNKRDWIFPFDLKKEKYLFKETFEKTKEFLTKKNELMLVRWDENLKPIDHGFVMQNGWPKN